MDSKKGSGKEGLKVSKAEMRCRLKTLSYSSQRKKMIIYYISFGICLHIFKFSYITRESFFIDFKLWASRRLIVDVNMETSWNLIWNFVTNSASLCIDEGCSWFHLKYRDGEVILW